MIVGLAVHASVALTRAFTLASVGKLATAGLQPRLLPLGALLITGTAAGTGAGALIGWAAGSVGYGILAGAFVGIPVGIVAVYLRYRGTM